MKYRNVSTHFVGFSGPYAPDGVKAAPVGELNTGVFFGLRAADGGPLLAGQMAARDGSGRQAVFLCNASDPWGDRRAESTVEFSADGAAVRILTAQGGILPEKAGGKYRFRLPSCGGALLTVG